jgi:hypothetical protein
MTNSPTLQHMRRVSVLVGAALATLAACSSGGGISNPPPPATSAAPSVDLQALKSWWTNGGDDVTAAMSADLGAVKNASDAGDVGTLRPACQKFAADAARGQALAAPPLKGASHAWANAMDSFKAASAQCLDAVRSGTVDESKVNLMTYSITQGTADLNAVTTNLR